MKLLLEHPRKLVLVLNSVLVIAFMLYVFDPLRLEFQAYLSQTDVTSQQIRLTEQLSALEIQYDLSKQGVDLNAQNGAGILVKQIDELCNRHEVTLFKMQASELFDIENQKFQIDRFQLIGNYASIVRMTHELEGAGLSAQLISLDMQLMKTARDRSQSLVTELCFLSKTP